MKTLRSSLVPVVLLLLVGCAAWAPKNARDVLGQAFITQQELTKTALDLHAAGVTTPAQESVIARQLEMSQEALSAAAAALAAGNEPEGQQWVVSASALLREVRQMLVLASREGKK